MVKRDDYIDAIERTLIYVFEHGDIPEYTMVNGKKVLKNDVLDACKRSNAYFVKNGKFASLVNMELQENIIQDNCYRSPRFISDVDKKQDTNYFCACNIAQQVLYELYGIKVPESELAKEMSTTVNGTSHDMLKKGIIKEANDHRHTVTVDFVNWSSKSLKEIGEMVANPSIGVFVHDKYKETWGHYEYLTALCIDKGTVTIANSLSGGYMEDRSLSTLVRWINMISQPSLGIVRKIS